MAEIKKPTAAEKIVVKNYYKELPEVPYQKTSKDFKEFVKYAQSINEVNIFALAIIANESSWGVDGVNNNYGGVQADAGRWRYPNFDKIAIATSLTIENLKKIPRRFIVFKPDNPIKDNYDFILYKVKDKGINTIEEYFSEWVGAGEPTPEQLADFNGTIKRVKNNYLNV